MTAASPQSDDGTTAPGAEAERAARLVRRQLRKSGLDVESGAPVARFVDMVRDTYAEADDQRRLNDHAFRVASDEMALLNQQLAEKNAALNDALESLLRSEQVAELNAELSEKNAELSRLANTDWLTGLLNRYSFSRDLRMALSEIGPHDIFVVAVIDLDRFKLINDTFGHQTGDRLLVQVADVLRQIELPGDLIARLGGDEFAFGRSVHTLGDVDYFADTLSNALHQPVTLDRQFLRTGGSVGLAVTDDPDADPTALMRDADTAMYRAKESSTTRFRVFDHRFRQEVTRRFALERELHSAIERHQIELVYQPIVDHEGRAVAIEALSRWSAPTLGRVSPDEFIPAIERLGLSGPFGAHVIETAATQLADWRTVHPEAHDVAITVNIAYTQLIDDRFVQMVEATLKHHDLSGACLIIEITESELLDDFDRAVAAIERLRGIGVRIAIDDFGTGYSALSYLARVPADFLKIDKSFVWSIDDRASEDRADNDFGGGLTSVIVDLAARLGLTAIAEGVETAAQLDALEACGCELLQGYLFCRPVASEAIPEHAGWTTAESHLLIDRAA